MSEFRKKNVRNSSLNIPTGNLCFSLQNYDKKVTIVLFILETYVIGMSLKICNYILQVGSKRKRAFEPDDMSQGAAKARQFLEAFVALPLETMDKMQALQEVKKLTDTLEKDAENCNWLQQFL